MTTPKTIKIISLDEFIAKARKDALETIEVDSELCEGCPNLMYDRCGSGQTLVECSGFEMDKNCLQLGDVNEQAEIQYDAILEMIEVET